MDKALPCKKHTTSERERVLRWDNMQHLVLQSKYEKKKKKRPGDLYGLHHTRQ